MSIICSKTRFKEGSLEITSRVGCKNMCKYCPQNKIIARYKNISNKIEMDFNTYKKCIDKVPKNIRIDFSGMSEPWLSGNCTKMLLYAYNTGHKKIAVFTTCVGMSLDDVEKIKTIPFEVFCVHLVDKDHNTRIKFNKNYFELINLINISKINNLEYMTMGKPHPKLKKLLGERIISKEMVSRAGNLNNFPKIYKEGKIVCSFPQWPNRNILLPNGDVLLCCMDYGMEYILGNLNSLSYKGLFRSQVYRNVVKRINNEKYGDVICRHCELAVNDYRLSTLDQIIEYFKQIKNVFFLEKK